MSDHQRHLEGIDRSLADIQVMGHIAIRAAQNLRLCKDDSDHYLLPEQEASILLFGVHDLLDRIEKLRANLDPVEAAAEPAKAAETDAGTLADTSDDRTPHEIVSGMMNKSDIDWALHQIEQMVIIARRSTWGQKPSTDLAYILMPRGDVQSLEYSLGDILDKVTALKDEWASEPNVAGGD
ncbi:hypothetical protein CT676_42680 [Bradyrhizobium sp. MOS001]|uniref:hypothetical protein n=1 Tax=unclassified Bradyrhizobium TaxID=2631580 RepID=UPI0010750901|nr:hypothetical protein [Bradyrhizobium sp. MOS001]TFW52273.1 hypothetical protein CT676_42680 [Bradyrhizobium sp. MOS001]